MKFQYALMLLCFTLFLADMTAQTDQTSDLTEISTHQFNHAVIAQVSIAPNSDDYEGSQDTNFSTSVSNPTGINPVQSAVERGERNLSNKATVDYEHPAEQRIKDWELPDEQTAESRLYAYQSPFSTSVSNPTGINPVQSAVERGERNLSNKATVDYEHPAEQRIKDWELPDEQTAESRLYAYQSPDDNPPDSGTAVEDADPDEGTFFANLMAWFRANLWAVVLGAMGFLKVIVNLTPTEKDDKIFAWLDNFISSIIPSRKTGGGTHTNA